MKTKIYLCLLLLTIAGCAAPQDIERTPTFTAPTQKPATATIPPPTSEPNLITVTGWFTTIWNGEAHYSITNDQGQTFKLQLDEELTKPLGGPLELDRKRVTITGELISEKPATIHVLSIQFAPKQ